MSKWTPGPWKAIPIDPKLNNMQTWAVVDNEGYSVINRGDSEEDRANAHAIAALPELVKATENLLDDAAVTQIASRGVNRVRYYRISKNVRDRLRQALAKVEAKETP